MHLTRTPTHTSAGFHRCLPRHRICRSNWQNSHPRPNVQVSWLHYRRWLLPARCNYFLGSYCDNLRRCTILLSGGKRGGGFGKSASKLHSVAHICREPRGCYHVARWSCHCQRQILFFVLFPGTSPAAKENDGLVVVYLCRYDSYCFPHGLCCLHHLCALGSGSIG